MKYYSRLNMYKSSNVKLDPSTMESYSYDWWQVTKIIDNQLIFNSYNYSPSTIKHQYKIRYLIDELGYREYLSLEVPCGLQDPEWQSKAVKHYHQKANELLEAMQKPRSHKKKNEERRAEINSIYRIIDLIGTLKDGE